MKREKKNQSEADRHTQKCGHYLNKRKGTLAEKSKNVLNIKDKINQVYQHKRDSKQDRKRRLLCENEHFP